MREAYLVRESRLDALPSPYHEIVWISAGLLLAVLTGGVYAFYDWPGLAVMYGVPAVVAFLYWYSKDPEDRDP